MMNLLRATSVALVTMTGLTACEAFNEADDLVSGISKRTADERARLRAAQRGQLHIVDRPFYGEAVKVERGSRSGKPLPKRLEGARSISVTTSGEAADIKTLADAISQQADMPVNIRTVYSLPEGEVIEIPIGSTMRVEHQGSLSKLLDQIGARMDVAWSYDGTAITFDRMVTRRYNVPIPTGGSNLTSSIGGVQGGNRTVTYERNIGGYDAWTDLRVQLEAVAPPPALLTFAQSSGRISVFGPPSVQARAAAVIADFDDVFSTRIGLEVAVFFIDASKSNEFAVGLSGSGSRGSINGVVGALTGNGVATLTNNFGSIDFQSVAKNDAVVDYRFGSQIAQSGVIAPIVLTESQNYVARTTNTTDQNGNVSTAVETATIDTGISIHALPRLVQNNRIQLSLTLLQNDLTELESFESGSSTVQLPRVNERALQNDSVLAPGETLVLSGYEQDRASRSNTGAGKARFLGLGGRTKGNVGKVRMVVMVRPAIIPAAG
ncbi:secretion protein [uncultured Ruegeria sp.]|uniref:secretion protein n=1 Tax=uncultured Ruegeria sp. TaxID=259304 RepID=UPI002627A490|nr:secretion protein [uncultured Ruegeria sp.]